MEKEGIIEGYTITVDHERLGYSLTAIIDLSLDKKRLIETEREISKLPNVYGVYDITGAMDAMIVAKFHSRDELNKFIKALLKKDYVVNSQTKLVLNVIKETLELPV
jgi:DNA-binding Lrp family transcriptional regulator